MTLRTLTVATLMEDVRTGPHMIVRGRWHGGVPSHITSRARVRLRLWLHMPADGRLGSEGDSDDAATVEGGRLEPAACVRETLGVGIGVVDMGANDVGVEVKSEGLEGVPLVEMRRAVVPMGPWARLTGVDDGDDDAAVYPFHHVQMRSALREGTGVDAHRRSRSRGSARPRIQGQRRVELR